MWIYVSDTTQMFSIQVQPRCITINSYKDTHSAHCYQLHQHHCARLICLCSDLRHWDLFAIRAIKPECWGIYSDQLNTGTSVIATILPWHIKKVHTTLLYWNIRTTNKSMTLFVRVIIQFCDLYYISLAPCCFIKIETAHHAASDTKYVLIAAILGSS